MQRARRPFPVSSLGPKTSIPAPTRQKLKQQRDLVLAADEGCHPCRPRRLEATDALDLSRDRPGENRRLEAFEGLSPARRQLERAAQQALCRTPRSRRCPAGLGAATARPDWACRRRPPVPAPTPVRARSPTTTMPIAGCRCGPAESPLHACRASRRRRRCAGPALTARSASSSWARGKPK